jgi:hypothetical protein
MTVRETGGREGAVARAGAGAAGTGKWRHYGLTFEAPFPLGSPAEPGLATDVVLRMGQVKPVGTALPGPVVAQVEIAGRQLYAVYRAGDAYLLRFADRCEFWVASNGREVTCEPVPGLEEGIVEVLSVGTVASLVLTIRGLAVLHGSAVQWQGLNVVFAGSSGWGKTTLAALCCAAGARLVADDLVAMETSGAAVVSTGLASELRLRESAKEILSLFASQPSWRWTADGRMALRPARAEGERHVVSAVVLPRPSREPADLELRSLRPAEAVSAILANSRVPAMVPIDWQQRYFGVAADLATSVPVVVATVPWGPPFTTAAATEILARLMPIARPAETGRAVSG